MEADHRETVSAGEGRVLPFRVEDGDHPAAAVDGELAAEEGLHQRGLPRADVTGDDAVRVGQDPGAVELEGVEVPARSAARDVHPDVGPSLADARVGVPGVHG